MNGWPKIWMRKGAEGLCTLGAQVSIPTSEAYCKVLCKSTSGGGSVFNDMLKNLPWKAKESMMKPEESMSEG